MIYPLDRRRRRAGAAIAAPSSSALPASIVFPGSEHLITSVGIPARTLREMTVSCWCKLNGPTARQGMITMSDTNPLTDRMFMTETHPAANFAILGFCGDDAGTISNWSRFNAGNATLYSVWHFMCFRLNSSGVGEFRIDTTWGAAASLPKPYSVFNLTGFAEIRVGAGNAGTNEPNAGTKYFQPTVSFRGLSDSEVTQLYNKDLSPADYSWDTTTDFDGTTLACNDPTYDLTVTGGAFTADSGDIP